MANSGRDTGWYWEFYDSAGSDSSPLIGYYIGRTSRYLTPIFSGPGVYTSPAHFAAEKGQAAGVTMSVALRGADGRSTQRARRGLGLDVGAERGTGGAGGIRPARVERGGPGGV